MAHGRGNSTAHGGGFGFGHAGVGNPGHNAMSTRSSNSQNTSQKAGTHDGRSFSNHAHSMHSLAQLNTPPSTKADQVPPADPVPQADQVPQVDDRSPGEKKGFVDSLPPAQELQADRGRVLNLETIHSDPDDIVIRGLPLDLELNLDRGKSLQVSWQAKVTPETIVPDTDDISTTAIPHRWELSDGRPMLRSTNPELDDDDEKWKFVPYFGAVLLFFSWILQSWTRREKGQSGLKQVWSQLRLRGRRAQLAMASRRRAAEDI